MCSDCSDCSDLRSSRSFWLYISSWNASHVTVFGFSSLIASSYQGAILITNKSGQRINATRFLALGFLQVIHLTSTGSMKTSLRQRQPQKPFRFGAAEVAASAMAPLSLKALPATSIAVPSLHRTSTACNPVHANCIHSTYAWRN